MSDNQGSATPGGCLGGLIGAPLGIWLGMSLTNSPHATNNSPENIVNSLGEQIMMLFALPAWGVAGAIFGAVLGAVVTASIGGGSAEAEEPGSVDPEPAEAEIARLKKRLAELETEKDNESQD